MLLLDWLEEHTRVLQSSVGGVTTFCLPPHSSSIAATFACVLVVGAYKRESAEVEFGISCQFRSGSGGSSSNDAIEAYLKRAMPT